MDQTYLSKSLMVFALAAACIQLTSAVITVNIGGANRLNSLSSLSSLSSLRNQRERYSCFWDCDLVGCQIASDDDECAYDCEKICRLRYDYAASGRSGAIEGTELKGKLDSSSVNNKEEQGDLLAGTSVRLHLPRNASARNFAIWERCAPDASTGKLTEKPFNL